MASQPPPTPSLICNQCLLPPYVVFERAAGSHVTAAIPLPRDDVLPLTSSPPSGSDTSGPRSLAGLQPVSPAITESRASPPHHSVATSPQVLVLQSGPVDAKKPRPFQVDNRRRRGQYDPQVWEGHKERIRQLYIDQAKPLREVIDTMAKTHNFHATEKMFKIRIKHWGFSKNNTRKDVAQMLKTRFVREAMGKRSQFIRNGRTVDIDDYLRRKGLTEYDVVDLESPVQEALRMVRCRTPPGPEHLALPDRLRLQEGYVLAVRRALQFFASDPREQDRSYWVTKNYTYIKDLRDALVQAQTGSTGQAIETLQAVLQTKLRDIDQLDSVGCVWLLLVPVTWAHVPVITTTLFKYLAASGVIKGQKGHPVASALKFAYDTVRESGLGELKSLVEHSRSTVYGEIERAMGSDYNTIARMWPWYVANRGPTTTWMMRGQIAELQKDCEQRFGVCNRESLWARLYYALSFAPGSREHLVQLQSLFALARQVNDVECLSIARGAAYFTYCYHWSLCQKDATEYNMRVSLARYWFEEANELEREMKAFSPSCGVQPVSHPVYKDIQIGPSSCSK